jgi:hypothetical protein
MSDEISEPEFSMSEQMERTSVNICTFSAMNPETAMPYNFPAILGGEDIISDPIAKLKVEEAFGQLNIQSLFGFESMVLQSTVYDTFRVDNLSDKLTPNIYLLKSFKNDVYLLNYLATPYSDLNIDSYFEEVDFMSNALSGVFRRTNIQVEKKIIDEEKQYEICKETVDGLVGFMHYQIFTERGMRALVNTVKHRISMILGMFFELQVDHNEWQCLGKCGKTFEKDDYQFQGKNPKNSNCPECNEALGKSPPIVKFNNCQFVYPENAVNIFQEKNPEDLEPTKYLGYLTGINMPRNLSLTVNRLSTTHFGTLVAIPKRADFKLKEDSNHSVQINTNYRIKDDKIFLFMTVSDTRYSGKEYEETFLPSLTAVTFNRDIVEGFKKGLSLTQIIKKSILSDWKLTETVEVSKLDEYRSFGDIKLFTGDQN